MRKLNLTAAFLGFLLVTFIAWYYASPYLALNNLKETLAEPNSEELAEQIDFDSVRNSLKSQLRANLAEELFSEDDGADGAFAALGSMFAMTLLDGLVDNLLTPESLVTLINVGQILPAGDQEENIANKDVDWSIERDGVNKFIAKLESDSQEDTKLVFKRSGLDWKLSEIHFPINWAVLNLKKKLSNYRSVILLEIVFKMGLVR